MQESFNGFFYSSSCSVEKYLLLSVQNYLLKQLFKEKSFYHVVKVKVQLNDIVEFLYIIQIDKETNLDVIAIVFKYC